MNYSQFKETVSQGVNKVSIGVSVSPAVKAKLTAVSEETGVNLSKIVETLINEFVQTIE